MTYWLSSEWAWLSKSRTEVQVQVKVSCVAPDTPAAAMQEAALGAVGCYLLGSELSRPDVSPAWCPKSPGPLGLCREGAHQQKPPRGLHTLLNVSLFHVGWAFILSFLPTTRWPDYFLAHFFTLLNIQISLLAELSPDEQGSLWAFQELKQRIDYNT